MTIAKPEAPQKAEDEVKVEVSEVQEIVQPQATQAKEQVAESAQEVSESVTLWDSLVVKKNEKPKKKHQGASSEDKPETKPDES